MAIYKRGHVWWADLWEQTPDGASRRVRCSLKTTSKRHAERLYAELLAKEQRSRLGLEAAPADQRGTIEPHWLAYQEDVEASSLAPATKRMLIRRVRLYLTAKRIVTLAQITAASVEAHLLELSRTPPAKASGRGDYPGLSSVTLTHHRSALVRFVRWLVERGTLTANPLGKRIKIPKTDPRHKRRPLTSEEFGRLLAVVPGYRRALYSFLALTGLRQAEARKVTWADLDLGRQLLHLRATSAKNRRAATLPLHPELVDLLQAFRSGALDSGWYLRREIPRGASDPVFPYRAARETWLRDLEAAEIERKTPAGIADQHGLRVKFATDLALSGATLQEAQRLMRHADPAMTARIYTRLGLDVLGGAVARLTLPDTPESQPGTPALAEQEVK